MKNYFLYSLQPKTLNKNYQQNFYISQTAIKAVFFTPSLKIYISTTRCQRQLARSRTTKSPQKPTFPIAPRENPLSRGSRARDKDSATRARETKESGKIARENRPGKAGRDLPLYASGLRHRRNTRRPSFSQLANIESPRAQHSGNRRDIFRHHFFPRFAPENAVCVRARDETRRGGGRNSARRAGAMYRRLTCSRTGQSRRRAQVSRGRSRDLLELAAGGGGGEGAVERRRAARPRSLLSPVEPPCFRAGYSIFAIGKMERRERCSGLSADDYQE